MRKCLDPKNAAKTGRTALSAFQVGCNTSKAGRLVAILVLSGIASLAPSAQAAGAGVTTAAPDLEIVADLRDLSDADIRSHDVTETSRGAALLQRAAERGELDTDARLYRAFVFGDQELLLSAATPLKAKVGLNSERAVVYELVPTAVPSDLAIRAGYAVPPKSAWQYNNDGSFQDTVGTWVQTMVDDYESE